VVPELGFSGVLWNGDEELSAGLSFTCGLWNAYAGLNCAVLDLPPLGAPGAQILYELTLVRGLVELTAEIWQADWAVATSSELRAARAWLPRQPIVGWLTYLSPARCPSTGLSVGEMTRTSGGGCILQLTPQWHGMSPNLIRVAAEELAREGCLRPH
jgi:hypothetical protein